MVTLMLFGSMVLFLVGVRMSAFFSGTETGFYRVSTLQLSLQAQRGDLQARGLQYFVSHPERFVATTLVGNNVANYLTTVAIGLIVTVFAASSGGVEILATILLTPVIFVFGELIPKSLYYRAPMTLLKRGYVCFSGFYFAFLPLSYPLILLSRLVSRIGRRETRPLEVVFGRTRLFSLLAAGQRAGILTEIQSRLAENLMQVANRRVGSLLTKIDAVGLPESATLEEVLKLAGKSGRSKILFHTENAPMNWTSYIRIADAIAMPETWRMAVHTMPEFEADRPQLEVLTELFQKYAHYGLVTESGKVQGIVNRRDLVSHLFRAVPETTTLPEPIVSTDSETETVAG